MQGSRIICFVYVRTSLRTVAIRLEYFIRVYAYAYAVHECDISTEIPYEFGYVLTRVIQDAQSRKSLARARVARARPRARFAPQASSPLNAIGINNSRQDEGNMTIINSAVLDLQSTGTYRNPSY